MDQSTHEEFATIHKGPKVYAENDIGLREPNPEHLIAISENPSLSYPKMGRD